MRRRPSRRRLPPPLQGFVPERGQWPAGASVAPSAHRLRCSRYNRKSRDPWLVFGSASSYALSFLRVYLKKAMETRIRYRNGGIIFAALRFESNRSNGTGDRTEQSRTRNCRDGDRSPKNSPVESSGDGCSWGFETTVGFPAVNYIYVRGETRTVPNPGCPTTGILRSAPNRVSFYSWDASLRGIPTNYKCRSTSP